MLRMIQQARAAISMLNPGEVRDRATRPIDIGLVAANSAGYAEIEDFLLPADMPAGERAAAGERIHGAGDPHVPETVDLVIYEQGIPRNRGAYTFHRNDPEATIKEILRGQEDMALALARQFPVFRKPVVNSVIQSVAQENALFAVATALPNVVPNLIELPWIFGEFASDTAFLTANQVRMAFVIAAAYGKDPAIAQQKAEILSIVAGAFGWRALARELVSHIPLGGGLIPKGAIAYAGTFAVGKSLEYFHSTERRFSTNQHREAYREGLKQAPDALPATGHPVRNPDPA
jgi:uncharacterized protein (DUF697 family)